MSNSTRTARNSDAPPSTPTSARHPVPKTPCDPSLLLLHSIAANENKAPTPRSGASGQLSPQSNKGLGANDLDHISINPAAIVTPDRWCCCRQWHAPWCGTTSSHSSAPAPFGPPPPITSSRWLRRPGSPPGVLPSSSQWVVSGGSGMYLAPS